MAKQKFTYATVCDRNGHKIDNLYLRGKSYYGRFTNTDSVTGQKKMQWVRLPLARDLTTAKEELGKVRAKRDNQELEFTKCGPPFKEYVAHYLSVTKQEKFVPNKPLKTWENESYFLNNYVKTFGDKPINKITAQDIIAHRTQRLREEISNVTAKLQVIALRNLYKRAILEGKTRVNPAALVKPLASKAKQKFLLTNEEITVFAEKAKSTLKRSGQQVADWIRLMAFSGCRPTEALSLKWENVDFSSKGKLTLPEEIVKGGYRSRVVEFNPELRGHLENMCKRKSNESWLFPSPRPNRVGGRQETFDHEFRKVRTAIANEQQTQEAKSRILEITSHFLRHFFISICCMSGVDMLTVVQWVGHADSKLIREIYSHLDNKHRVEQASKLSFNRS